jgi:hypothetical protein
MVSVTKKVAVRVIASAIRVAALGFGLPVFPVSAAGQEAPTFRVWEFGVIPRPALVEVLLGFEAVQDELKITDAQKKEQTAIEQADRQKFLKARREAKDLAKFRETRDALYKESEAATLATLKPEQRERLDQIQIQAQGPLAFDRRDRGSWGFVGLPLSERLKLTEDQAKRVRMIFEEGEKEIEKAASFPIAIDTKSGPPTMESIRKLVETPEFQTAKEKASKAGRDASTSVIHRIEEVLTDEQRTAYHKLLGKPFDLSKLRGNGPQTDEREFDARVAASALGVGGGGGGGQRADPNFNTKVARPAYAGAPKHPRVLFDEAHHNFHTAGGRYKPFADLMTSDGYEVIPNPEKFSRDVLKKGDILVIANALGAEGMGQPEASNPAFTDAECDAVRDWINDGGSLLFIADHAPMGAAAQCLAKRLGVSMSKGATSDPSHSEGGDTWLVFTRQNQLLNDHPITRGRDQSERVNRIQTFTGTSVKGPEGSVPILKLADTAVDLAMEDEKPASAAGRAQGVAFSLGRGRVVVMGEAAELSAQVFGADEKFGMNVPGIDNRQMAINIMHWLSGLLEPRARELKKAG